MKRTASTLGTSAPAAIRRPARWQSRDNGYSRNTKKHKTSWHGFSACAYSNSVRADRYTRWRPTSWHTPLMQCCPICRSKTAPRNPCGNQYSTGPAVVNLVRLVFDAS